MSSASDGGSYKLHVEQARLGGHLSMFILEERVESLSSLDILRRNACPKPGARQGALASHVGVTWCRESPAKMVGLSVL